ncbi:MAG: PKD domain-containing protein, partial [Chitinophagaceae bacterium]
LALHQAINNHINTTSYNGVAYKDVINYIDVRGYGAFGEWHSYTIVDVMSQYPAGTRATTTSLNRIIDTHVDGFPNFPLVMLVSAFDGNRLGNTMNPPEVAYHALTRRNSWGPLGWRRDNWGATDTYLRWYTDQNTLTVNGMRLDTAIMNRWKYAPIVGEPCCNANYADLETQVRRYHAVSFGNGNFSPSSTINPNIRAASKAAGYRIVLEGGNVPASVNTGTSFGINLQWKNVGLTQSYEDWQVLYELKNSGGTAVWSSASSFQMKHFMPETNARSHTDNVTLPGSVNAGTYTLTVKVRDVDGFRQPMPLAITGRNSDGSYNLRSVTVGAGGGTSNQAPVANAGSNQTITLPTATAQLNGSASADADGSISSYLWQQVSGPSASTLSSTSTASITVSNLQQGVYSYRLTVTDNGGLQHSATVSVTVNAAPATNQPPVANAGNDRSITLPTNSASLSGSGSSDPDGTISSYLWQQISGPSTSTLSSTSTANITVSNLVQGQYRYRLTVRDNSNASHADTVQVTVNPAPVNNQPPVANAGNDRSITLPTNSASLSGSGSSDPDGTISSYLWQQISGPSTSTLSSTSTANITVSNLVQGQYRYRLTVRDNSNASHADTVQVTVNAAPNQAPVANAGSNQTIILPANSAQLSGTASSDPDGSISSYRWQQVSGPSNSVLSSTTTATIAVSQLQEGIYTYRLTVTDNLGATASATVSVAVQKAANTAPVANAGSDISIYLPVNSVTLTGAASADANGTITGYLWQQLSGPSQATIAVSSAVTAVVSNLQEGIYYFSLTVTDNDGATSTDNVKVTVNAASNQAPVANAGSNQIIVKPVDQVDLNGTASSDADGQIVSYEWSQVSGPSSAYLSGANQATASASRFDVGVYTFRLKVTDDKGASATATATVTVKEAVNNTANQPPVAHSGWDRTLYLPESSMNLDGTRSYDPDGRIVSYRWTQIAGPRRASFAYVDRPFTLVYNMSREGVYKFRLKVTDDKGASAYSTVTITVAKQRRYRNYGGHGRSATAANDSVSVATPEKTPESLNAALPEEESISELKASLYPNPASSQVQVTLDDDYQGKLQVAVYSMNGERVQKPLIFEKKAGKWQTTMNIQSLKAGMYNLEILSGKDSRKVLRFIKL